MPETLASVPSKFSVLGLSWRKVTAISVANSGVLLVRQEEIDAPRRSIPLKMK